VLIYLYSCKKETVAKSQPTIIGKWNLLSDTTYVLDVTDYSGQPGDYFDIRTNGHIYTKEGPVLDTLTYSLVSSTEMTIETFGVPINGVPEISQITNLTAHSATINAPIQATPDGPFGRKVTLSR
jgi:hypothetical protein